MPRLFACAPDRARPAAAAAHPGRCTYRLSEGRTAPGAGGTGWPGLSADAGSAPACRDVGMHDGLRRRRVRSRARARGPARSARPITCRSSRWAPSSAPRRCWLPATTRTRRASPPRLPRCAQAAAPFGLSADLEFMPWTKVPDARTALRVVLGAAQPNGGVLVDALHVARSATSLADLAAIPRERLHYAQICDAPAEVPSTVEGLIHAARCERLLPGDGGIDLAGIFSIAAPRVANQRRDSSRPGGRSDRRRGMGAPSARGVEAGARKDRAALSWLSAARNDRQDGRLLSPRRQTAAASLLRPASTCEWPASGSTRPRASGSPG